jgi:hypothetical protein
LPDGGLDHALVGGGLAAVEHPLRALGDPLGDLGAHQLRGCLAHDGVGGGAALLGEMAVGEEDAAVAVEVGHRVRDVVGVEAQLRLLDLERLAQPVVAVDVDHQAVQALDRAVLADVGNQVHAHPALDPVLHAASRS